MRSWSREIPVVKAVFNGRDEGGTNQDVYQLEKSTLVNLSKKAKQYKNVTLRQKSREKIYCAPHRTKRKLHQQLARGQKLAVTGDSAKKTHQTNKINAPSLGRLELTGWLPPVILFPFLHSQSQNSFSHIRWFSLGQMFKPGSITYDQES